jgi:hypothetical protein
MVQAEPENFLCPDQKATNKKYRDEYDRIFRKSKKEKKEDSNNEGDND